MLVEAENYCLLLLEDELYKLIEDTYVWLLNHERLPNEVRAKFGVRIFEIDPYYNPNTRLDSLFPRLVTLKPQPEILYPLAHKMLDYLEKQNSKKSLGTAFAGQNEAQSVQSYRDFAE
jgi:hypothetical protein